MKFLKRKGDETTIRKVWNDDKTILYGVLERWRICLKLACWNIAAIPKRSGASWQIQKPVCRIGLPRQEKKLLKKWRNQNETEYRICS